MFSNRSFGLKLAAAVLVIAGMGIFSAVRGSSIHPALWRCVAEPARWDGARLWLGNVTVLSSDAAGFEIEADGERVRAVPAAPVAPNEKVDLVGVFRSRGPVVEYHQVRRSPPWERARLLSEVVSAGVLALILLNFLRHFAARPKALQLKGTE